MAPVSRMQFRERESTIEMGEFPIVPPGVDQPPVAEDDCYVALFGPAATLNTSNVPGERTRKHSERT